MEIELSYPPTLLPTLKASAYVKTSAYAKASADKSADKLADEVER